MKKFLPMIDLFGVLRTLRGDSQGENGRLKEIVSGFWESRVFEASS